MKRKTKLVLDAFMVLSLPALMAYALLGDYFHELLGTATSIVFAVHHYLNRGWHKSFFKGKQNAWRIVQTTLNVALFALMIIQPISGILTSKRLFAFLPALSLSAKARSAHLVCSYWFYVLASAHAGTRLNLRAAKSRRAKIARALAAVLVAGVSVYGGYAFVKRGFFGYMTGKTLFAFFNYNEPEAAFFADYLSVMILFATIGLLARTFLKKSASTRYKS